MATMIATMMVVVTTMMLKLEDSRYVDDHDEDCGDDGDDKDDGNVDWW